MRSPPQLVLSGLLYPLHFVEGFLRSEFWVLRKRNTYLWIALAGVVAAGASTLFLLRTVALPAGLTVSLLAYFAGAAIVIFLRFIFALLSRGQAA